MKRLMELYVDAILNEKIKMKSEKIEILDIELSERISDIELGKVEGLSEKELFELLN